MELQDTALARQVGEAMLAQDQASQSLGMTLDSCEAGQAVVSMTVTSAMLNGHGTCHGGMIFSLADSAFAFACNSRNASTVAAGCTIEFLSPASLGERLTARAQERTLRGKAGIYDVDVFAADRLVAIFRGKSHRIAGTVLAAEPPAQ